MLRAGDGHLAEGGEGRKKRQRKAKYINKLPINRPSGRYVNNNSNNDDSRMNRKKQEQLNLVIATSIKEMIKALATVGKGVGVIGGGIRVDVIRIAVVVVVMVILIIAIDF